MRSASKRRRFHSEEWAAECHWLAELHLFVLCTEFQSFLQFLDSPVFQLSLSELLALHNITRNSPFLNYMIHNIKFFRYTYLINYSAWIASIIELTSEIVTASALHIPLDYECSSCKCITAATSRYCRHSINLRSTTCLQTLDTLSGWN